MQIEHHRGDLFQSGYDVIGHGVNCAGKMGAGIAAAVRENFPTAYTTYLDNYRSLMPGQALFASVGGGVWIVHLASQFHPGPNAQAGWIAASLVSAFTVMDANEVFSATWDQTRQGTNKREIAIPRIGAGIGGLNWGDVEAAIRGAGWDHCTVHVYTLEG